MYFNQSKYLPSWQTGIEILLGSSSKDQLYDHRLITCHRITWEEEKKIENIYEDMKNDFVT